MKAFQSQGIFENDGHHLVLDQKFPEKHDKPVTFFILFDDHSDEISEQEWLKSLASNPAFADLSDPQEDIYTANDGKPVSYKK